MIAFYLQIKIVHIVAVLLSGALFALRGGAILAGARWPNAGLAKYTSYTIDTVLLTAALMLVTILPGGFFANGWLAVKIALLVLYIVLGTIALKRGKTPRARGIAYALALATYAFIISVARAHHPLGVFA